MAGRTGDLGNLQELKVSLAEMRRTIEILGVSRGQYKSCPLTVASQWRHASSKEQYWRHNGYWVID